MLRRRSLATIALLIAFAGLAAGCGVDAGDSASPSTTGSSGSSGTSATTAPDGTDTEDLSPMEQEALDRVKDLYVDMGMDPDDADCLARGLIAGGATEGTFDPSDTGAVMDIINECDISIGELNDLGSDSGITSMEDGLKFGLESSLEASGLTEEEAACVASDFVDQYGSDMTVMQDQEKVSALLEGCDVDPSKLGG